jgi:predicted metal-dependent hydrolase
MVDGESHYYLGNRYRLRVIICDSARPGVHIRNKTRLELSVPSSADASARRDVLAKWYRSELKALLEPLVQKWEKRLGVKASEWGVKKMKTKWGTCNAEARRIWINLELVKKSLDCLEYVVAHELAHLLVRHHDDRFVAIMNKHVPRWRSIRNELNLLPLAHELWQK